MGSEGPSIPADRRARIFESDFPTGDEGLGLGRAIVKRMLDAHERSNDLVESDDGGVRFEVTDIVVAPVC